VRGDSPALLVVKGTALVAGTVDASAQGRFGGAGGGDGGKVASNGKGASGAGPLPGTGGQTCDCQTSEDNYDDCGGGGGGAWGEYPRGQRLNVLRVEEALSTGAEVIATACPYCIRMLNDAVRALGIGDRIAVRDLAELLRQSVMMEDGAGMTERVDLGIDREVCHV